MYDELVKRMRKCATEAGACKTCELDSNPSCTDVLMEQAADAIEELQADKAALNGTVTNLLEQIKALGKPRWIPANERLPEDGSDILAVQSYCGEVRIIPANYDRGVWYDCVFNRVAEHISHWMPLPPVPKEET